MILTVGLLARIQAATTDDFIDPYNGTTAELERGRKLFPLYAINQKCARLREVHESVATRRGCARAPATTMAMSDGNVKGPVKALEMLALNDDLNTVVYSDSMCTRRQAMARAAGLAAGLALSQGDSVTWTNNKGGPHNVVFDEDAIPSGVSQEAISMDDQLGEEGATFSKKFDTAGKYSYYCEPHRGAGMNAELIVE